MRKYLELTDGCIAKAGEMEMCFTLLSRDKAAADTIRFWVNQRIGLGLNTFSDKQILEALACADVMEAEGAMNKPLKPLNIVDDRKTDWGTI